MPGASIVTHVRPLLAMTIRIALLIMIINVLPSHSLCTGCRGRHVVQSWIGWSLARLGSTKILLVVVKLAAIFHFFVSQVNCARCVVIILWATPTDVASLVQKTDSAYLATFLAVVAHVACSTD